MNHREYIIGHLLDIDTIEEILPTFKNMSPSISNTMVGSWYRNPEARMKVIESIVDFIRNTNIYDLYLIVTLHRRYKNKAMASPALVDYGYACDTVCEVIKLNLEAKIIENNKVNVDNEKLTGDDLSVQIGWF